MENTIKSWVDKNTALKIAIFNLVVFAILFFWEVMNGMPLTKKGSEPYLSEDSIFHPIAWLALEGNVIHFIKKPWTILTYMFVHERLLSFLPNMIWLFLFGNILESGMRSNRLLPIYIMGGLIGGLVYVISSSLLHINYYATSASISVMTIAAVITTLKHDYKVFQSVNGGFSLWILTLIYAILTLITIGSLPNILAHIGGIAFGYFFVRQLRKGKDCTLWLANILNKLSTAFEPTSTLESNAGNREATLNRILDKISSKGLRSLSKEEKTFLRQHSK